MRREDLPASAPRAISEEAQRRLLRMAERAPVRDRAIVVLLLYTGLRLAELVALDVEDLRMSPRKGLVVVRSGKGDAYAGYGDRFCLGTSPIMRHPRASPAIGEAQGRYASALVCAHLREDADVHRTAEASLVFASCEARRVAGRCMPSLIDLTACFSAPAGTRDRSAQDRSAAPL